MLKKNFIVTFLLFTSCPVFAWLCPNNFNNIDIGDSLAYVEQQCGATDTQTMSKSNSNVPEEWNYYIAINPANQNKLKLSLVFIQNQVSNITMNGMSLTSTAACGNTISIGNSLETVQAVCGKPDFINKSQQNEVAPSVMIEFHYNSTPPMTLLFENSKLKDKHNSIRKK